jgi:hypothetical protein
MIGPRCVYACKAGNVVVCDLRHSAGVCMRHALPGSTMEFTGNSAGRGKRLVRLLSCQPPISAGLAADNEKVLKLFTMVPELPAPLSTLKNVGFSLIVLKLLVTML